MRLTSNVRPSRDARPQGGGRERSSGRRIGFWIAVAALLHAELLLLVGVGLYLFAPRSADLARDLSAGEEPSSIDVGMLDEDAAREIVADLDKQEEARKAEEIKKEEEVVRAPGQVVDLPAPREEKRPEDARFVAEHDSTVAHETKKNGAFQENARQGDEGGTGAESRPAEPRGDGRLAMRSPDLGRFLKEAGAASPAGRVGRAGATYGAFDPGHPEPEGTLPELGEDGHPRPGGGGAQGGAGLTLLPSEQQLARAIGSGTQDALPHVDDGEDTALNAKKWRFASFFNRIKRQVAEHWHPEEIYRQRDPTGMIYGRKNRYTSLRIQLKPDGRLSNVAVEQPSGLDFLDDTAIEAFKEAAPFPNPPHQLIESNGLINFGFGFLFDLNGPPEMRWFKY
jgi:TonB family protein